jgi:hypothetical protein
LRASWPNAALASCWHHRPPTPLLRFPNHNYQHHHVCPPPAALASIPSQPRVDMEILEVEALPQVPNETPGQDPEGGSECEFNIAKSAEGSEDPQSPPAEPQALLSQQVRSAAAPWARCAAAGVGRRAGGRAPPASPPAALPRRRRCPAAARCPAAPLRP